MERVQGTRVKEKLEYLNKTQWLAAEQLQEIQNAKLAALLKHAYKNVPYYRRAFDELHLKPEDIKTPEDLALLPVLGKQTIKNNLQDLVAVNIPKSRMIESHSSGSTGQPLKYYMSKDSYSTGWANTFRCWGWAGYRLGDPYVKISLNARSKAVKKLQDRIFNCLYIYAFDINEENIGSYMEKIRRSGSKIIRGYASTMYLLSKYLEDAQGPDLSLNGIMTTGETLHPHYREAIEERFGCRVYDCYGGESTPMAYECGEHSGYHMCDESVIIEFLKGNEKASPNEMASIVFTNLENYAMPYIRYKIGDIGVPTNARCRCGRGLSMLRSVEGRDTDIVVTPERKFLVAQFFAVLFEYTEGVDQFQVVQDRLEELNIKVVKNNRFTDADGQRVIDEVRRYAGDAMKINLEYVDYIPPTRSGKRRFVVSKVPVDSAWA